MSFKIFHKCNKCLPEIEPSIRSSLMSLYTYLKEPTLKGDPVDKIAFSVDKLCVFLGATPFSSRTASHLALVPRTEIPEKFENF